MRVDAQVDSSRAIVLIEDLLPRLSSIARTEHTALRIRRVRMTQRRYIHDVGIRRIDANARNRLCVAQPDVFPRLARVGRFVHAVALHDVAAQLRLAHAQIDKVGIRFRHCDRADRGALNLPIGHRTPRGAAIGGLPQSSADGAEIIFVGTRRAACRCDRTSSALRTDTAPLQCTENRRIVFFRASCRGAKKNRYKESFHERGSLRIVARALASRRL